MSGCTRETHMGDIIGASCPECGHTNLVHPGEHNPRVEECILCALVDQLEELAR